MTDPPCRANVSFMSVGSACDLCGHATLVHPGTHNPSLKECLICTVQYQMAQLWEVYVHPAVMVMGQDEVDKVADQIRNRAETQT